MMRKYVYACGDILEDTGFSASISENDGTLYVNIHARRVFRPRPVVPKMTLRWQAADRVRVQPTSSEQCENIRRAAQEILTSHRSLKGMRISVTCSIPYVDPVENTPERKKYARALQRQQIARELPDRPQDKKPRPNYLRVVRND